MVRRTGKDFGSIGECVYWWAFGFSGYVLLCVFSSSIRIVRWFVFVTNMSFMCGGLFRL